MLYIFVLLLSVFAAQVSFGDKPGQNRNDRAYSASNDLFYFWIWQWNEFGEWEETLVEGIVHSSPSGESVITWMWIIDGSSIEFIPITPEEATDPYYEVSIHNLGESRRVISLHAKNYPKGSPLSQRKGERAQPLPSGFVLLDRPPLSPSDAGWAWGGWLLTFDRIEDDDAGECTPPNPGGGGERYVIPVSETEILIVIIHEDGTVTVLVYRLGADGCWRFGVTPDTYEPPPLPGFTGAQAAEYALAEYVYQFIQGNFQHIPPFPPL